MQFSLSNMIPFFTVWYKILVRAQKHSAMCPLTMLEGVGLKKSYRTERAQQSHTQMGVAHMGTDGSMGGQGSLRAPLSLTLIDPQEVTYIDMHRCHLSEYIGL